VRLIQELEMAILIAKQGGKLAQTIRDQGYSIQDKANDLGPATDADLAVSSFLFDEISRHFPMDTIVSEEAPTPICTNASNRIWFIDPIDGTKEFIKGANDWSVMIGLAVDGVPSLGVVFRPDLDELYYASRASGAFFCTPEATTLLQVNSITEPEESILIQSRSHRSAEADQLAKSLGVKNTFSLGSIGLKLGKIAEGEADIYFNFSGRCHLWDLCGPEAILAEAGGTVALSSGDHILYSLEGMSLKESFVATNPHLLNKIQSYLQ
jgi:3'(2'), 5'-bisphosphate nucleotidase